jgi:hypothetical protein
MSRAYLPSRAVTLAIGLPILLMQPAMAFECPAPQAQAGAVPESQAEIDWMSDLLRTGDLDNRIEGIARDLKARHASADRTELTDFMVGAYCPVVADDARLSDSEKDARLAAFSEQMWDLLGKAGP